MAADDSMLSRVRRVQRRQERGPASPDRPPISEQRWRQSPASRQKSLHALLLRNGSLPPILRRNGRKEEDAAALPAFDQITTRPGGLPQACEDPTKLMGAHSDKATVHGDTLEIRCARSPALPTHAHRSRWPAVSSCGGRY